MIWSRADPFPQPLAVLLDPVLAFHLREVVLVDVVGHLPHRPVVRILVPAQAGITVGEYAPNAVKKTVVGVGHADKGQVDHMVRIHLPGVQIAGADAADALAIAICHAHHLQSAGRLQAALRKAAG